MSRCRDFTHNRVNVLRTMKGKAERGPTGNRGAALKVCWRAIVVLLPSRTFCFTELRESDFVCMS
jgi:hypothetical protein